MTRADAAWRTDNQQRIDFGPYAAAGFVGIYGDKTCGDGADESIALDGRPFGIACGQVNVGNAATPMTARMAKG